MATEYTQEKLEEMVVGKNPNPRAIFFEQAVLNVEKSKKAERRVYDRIVYIKLSQVGVTDSVSYAAEKEDIRTYPDEYAYFLQNKQGVRKPSIEIIPSLDIAHLQELRDYGILTIPQLAELEDVPPHLEYAHEAAKVFNSALKEISSEQEEGSKESSTVHSKESSTVQTKDVHQADRQEHVHDVRRSELPRSTIDNECRGDTGRHDTDRRTQRGNEVNWNSFDNWSMEFKRVR